jgi:hypothetical protein
MDVAHGSSKAQCTKHSTIWSVVAGAVQVGAAVAVAVGQMPEDLVAISLCPPARLAVSTTGC